MNRADTLLIKRGLENAMNLCSELYKIMLRIINIIVHLMFNINSYNMNE